jgi:hypothetical protein
MPVIPNAPDCKFSFPFNGITAETLVHALKVRVDGENGSLNGDVISGDIELDSLQGQIDLIYRIRGQLIDLYISRKGDFVECGKVAAMLRKMVDEAVVSAKNDPNPQLLEFDDEDEDDGGSGGDDDEEYEVEDEDADAQISSTTQAAGTTQVSGKTQVPGRAPPASSPPRTPSPRAARSAAQIQAVRDDLGAMGSDTKRKLLIVSAVVIVAIGGFVLMGRTPKET